MRATLTAGLLFGLAGCGPNAIPATRNDSAAVAPSPSASPVTPTPRPTATASSIVVAIEGEGLRLIDPDSGRTRPIAFGTPRRQTLSALAARGQPETGTNTECGAGPLAWARFSDGLTVQFQDDRFAGWSVDRAAEGKVTTMAGIGPGSTRAALEGAYAITLPDSTLGIEFAAGGMGGLLDGPGKDAEVTDMWAGVTCMFR
ncbi:hypothetical protein [uncultured Sphingomonas sp.]|uniref:hypothetical protein n=1 Tax=uncultured Sphingomonas sp. TaxID=158754 RepID=UPI0025CFCB3B|nr:hypothetical protein [uncultured Sphingomonas sp.]